MKKINLLPKTKQREFRYELLYKSIRMFVIVSMSTFALVFVGQLITKLVLEHRLSTLGADIEQAKLSANKSENAKLKEQIKLLNAQIADFKTLSDRVPHWSKVLEAFVKLVPSGVKINTFAADIQRKRVDINGIAQARSDALDLHKNISAATNEFLDINYPFENLVKERYTNFRYTFTIKESLLK